MSHATYLHFFASEPVDVNAEIINRTIDVLGVHDIVDVTRYTDGLRTWDFLLTGDEELPDYEILRQRVTPNEAGAYFEPGKHLSIACVKGHPSDRRAQLVYLLHERFPAELQREFYMNNLVVKAGPHDVFECIENPEGELFARTNFSVAFWGYRYPANIEEFRRFVLDCDLVREIQTDLARATSSSIDCRLYLT